MTSVRSVKPLVSALLAILFVLAFVVPFLQYNYLAGPLTPFDKVQAGSIRYGVIFFFGLLWLGTQLFWKASPETSKLSMAASATIIWLSVALFFNFNGQPEFGGPVAFFLLMGGLGIVLLWTRFMSDELTY